MAKKLKPEVIADLKDIPAGQTFTISEDVYMAEDTTETPQETAIEPSPTPITFTIFETLVIGSLIFHPGQEQALYDAFKAGSVTPGEIRRFYETGSLRGKFPNMPQVERQEVIYFATGN